MNGLVAISRGLRLDQVEGDHIRLGTLGKGLPGDGRIAANKAHVIVGEDQDLRRSLVQQQVSVLANPSLVGMKKCNSMPLQIDGLGSDTATLVADQRVGLQVHGCGQTVICLADGGN